MNNLQRRTFLIATAAATVTPVLARALGTDDMAPVRAALQRLLPHHAGQFYLALLPREGSGDRFEVGGSTGAITVRGTSPATLLAGVHWYLKYGAQAQLSWAGSQIEHLPRLLPSPARPIAQETPFAHRYAINDTDDGYSGPYRGWPEWERMIDILALHGCNEMLVTVGQEAVMLRLLQQFGYGESEARAWIPGQAHQPWWWLQNMSAFGGPVSARAIARRVALGQRIVARLRELGITPVFPGYYGSVPADFAARNPGAHVIPQGDWCGFERPSWLDPTSPLFARVAETFYREQERLFGAAGLFKMDPLHEGGKAGGVDLSAAAQAIQAALLKAHPDATWVVLGWLKNPKRELLEHLDRRHILIVDGVADRFDQAPDRESDWMSTPYAYGTIPNFGGHTTIGARADKWRDQFFVARAKPGSALAGTAMMPESSYRDAAAFELFSELAWHDVAPDLDGWFADYARYRYGGEDAHARAAWAALARTAYRLQGNDRSSPADSLFCARPQLDAVSAETWAPPELGYDPAQFARALRELLAVAPALRQSEAYRYDLVDVARQELANRARAVLPRLREAYGRRDRAAFARGSRHWLEMMALGERLLATHEAFLLGPWLAQARAAGADAAERARCEYDARSLLTTWGPRGSDPEGLHDYASREWSGLMADLYLPRWRRFFAALDHALEAGGEPEKIDWFGMEDAWAHGTGAYPVKPVGSSYAVASEVATLVAQPLPV